MRNNSSVNSARCKKRNVDFKNDDIALILFVIILLLCSAVIFYIMGFNKESNTQITNISNITRNLDYKVYLFENNFIDSEYLEKDQMYISDLVKNFSTEFKYNFSSSTKQDFSYTYDIQATIHGEYKNNSADTYNSVWEKSYILLETTTKSLNDATNFLIDENATVDFVNYNNEVSTFRKKLQLPLNAYLTVKMHVVVSYINSSGEKITEDDSNIEMSIPLNEQAFKVTENFEQKTNKVTSVENPSTINLKYMLLGTLTSITSLLLFFGNIKQIFKLGRKSIYKKELDKILKSYGEIIVEVSTPIEKKDLNIIGVKNFNEMIDIEEELRIPIILYEDKENSIAQFTILQGSILYEYIIKDTSNINKRHLNKEIVRKARVREYHRDGANYHRK